MYELQLTRCKICEHCKLGTVIGGKISKTCAHPEGFGLRGYLQDDAGCIYGSPKTGYESEYYISTEDATKLRLDIFLDSYFGRDLKFRLADAMQSIVHRRIAYLRPSVKFATPEDISDDNHKWHKYLKLRVQSIIRIDPKYPDCLVVMLYVPEGY